LIYIQRTTKNHKNNNKADEKTKDKSKETIKFTGDVFKNSFLFLFFFLFPSIFKIIVGSTLKPVICLYNRDGVVIAHGWGMNVYDNKGHFITPNRLISEMPSHIYKTKYFNKYSKNISDDLKVKTKLAVFTK
jgi:hypothetical protein